MTSLTSVACWKNVAIRPREHALSTRKTDPPETFNDDDDDDRLELLRRPRAMVSSFKWFRDEDNLILEATPLSTLVCKSGNFAFEQPWFSAGSGQGSRFPQLHFKPYLAKVLRVPGAVQSQVLFSLDTIRIEQR